MVSMANRGRDTNASQFFITTGANLDGMLSLNTVDTLLVLDDRHTIFGKVEEGLETLSKINNAFADKDGKPLQVVPYFFLLTTR
jgi:peptidyl-prolyl cis-trans isomerase-like 4